jgi:hypothetical protein
MQIQETQAAFTWGKGLAWAGYGAALLAGGIGTVYGLYIFVMGFYFGPALAFFLSYVALISGAYLYWTIRTLRSAARYVWYRWLPVLLGVPAIWYLLITTTDSLRGF